MTRVPVLPYHQRQNKYVERQIFVEMLRHVDCWKSIRKYLYIGFAGVYFEDFKLLHNRFGIEKMISIEQEHWIVLRQRANLPYGCIAIRHQTSSDFVQNVDRTREAYPTTDHLLIWLDYATASELPNQLNEVRALIPKLEVGDVLKITISANPRWLSNGPGTELQNRLENLKNSLGAVYLADGLREDDVQNDKLPGVLLDALKRKISEGMTESPRLYFLPLGCYVYRDSTTMLTATGIVLHRGDEDKFLAHTGLRNFDFSSLQWQLHPIDVPYFSLHEKLALDRLMFGKSAAEIAQELNFQFEEDREDSLQLIENYKKLYRYYPTYYRVQL